MTLRIGALLGWVATVGMLTLTPAGYTPPLTLEAFVCIGCGWRGTSDILLNWAMFVPGGVLTATLLERRRALLLVVAFTVVIEIVQIGIPGRFPALQDLVFNTLGAVSGAVLVSHGLGRLGQRLLAGIVVIAWLSPIGLLIPMTSAHDLYGQWTPVFGGSAHYEGRILSASVGTVETPSRRVEEKAALDRAIVTRQPIELRLRIGPPPSSLAPVFQVADSHRDFILTIGAVGQDLIVRGNNPATVLGLDQPDVRWNGAMEGVTPGDTVILTVDRSVDSVCISLDERTECALAPSLGDGWGFLIYLEGGPNWIRTLTSLAWALGLGLVLGLMSDPTRWALVLGPLLALAGYVASYLSPDVSASAVHAVLLAGGSLAGIRLRRPFARLWTTHLGSHGPRATESPSPG